MANKKFAVQRGIRQCVSCLSSLLVTLLGFYNSCQLQSFVGQPKLLSFLCLPKKFLILTVVLLLRRTKNVFLPFGLLHLRSTYLVQESFPNTAIFSLQQVLVSYDSISLALIKLQSYLYNIYIIQCFIGRNQEQNVSFLIIF